MEANGRVHKSKIQKQRLGLERLKRGRENCWITRIQGYIDVRHRCTEFSTRWCTFPAIPQLEACLATGFGAAVLESLIPKVSDQLHRFVSNAELLPAVCLSQIERFRQDDIVDIAVRELQNTDSIRRQQTGTEATNPTAAPPIYIKRKNNKKGVD